MKKHRKTPCEDEDRNQGDASISQGMPKIASTPSEARRETSLVAQWIRICLPMQETRIRSLVQEDPTCCGATKPVCHNY